MINKRALLGLSMALLMAPGAPAKAADVLMAPPPGLKDRGGPMGIPVPAPIPVPEYYSWYLRADIALGFFSQPGLSEQGLVYGVPGGAGTFGSQSTFGSSGLFNYSFTEDFTVNWGLGVGYYFTPRLRGDITVDIRSEIEAKGRASYSYAEYSTAIPGFTGNTITGSSEEKLKIRGTLTMANLYWDLTKRGGFTPYVGVGLGFMVHQIQRQHTSVEQSTDCCGAPVGSRGWTNQEKVHDVSLAAAAMIGFSYAWDTRWALDVNYRYLFVGGSSVPLALNTSESKLSIDDLHEHQLRAGVRVNLY
ncbi:MAG: outer membrane beta-barrel protein [Hyphomicrobiaceae bacterium]|nr:outer membrane beta-barrel protein [Hyphomicrobiaceae bacterium]